MVCTVENIIVEISGDVTMQNIQTTGEYSATQSLDDGLLSFAIGLEGGGGITGTDSQFEPKWIIVYSCIRFNKTMEDGEDDNKRRTQRKTKTTKNTGQWSHRTPNEHIL